MPYAVTAHCMPVTGRNADGQEFTLPVADEATPSTQHATTTNSQYPSNVIDPALGHAEMTSRAVLGEVSAAFQLAYNYEVGQNGATKDTIKAEHFYEQAANHGHAQAQCNLGMLHYRGKAGLPNDTKKAVQLWDLAARQGHVDAQFKLALMYEGKRGVRRIWTRRHGCIKRQPDREKQRRSSTSP